MPAKDLIHDAVRHALEKDGWTITRDPLFLRFAGESLFADLAAEQLIAAEKTTRKIAVEIKTFNNPSVVEELQKTVGKVRMYRYALSELEPARTLYVAVSERVRKTVFAQGLGAIMQIGRAHV